MWGDAAVHEGTWGDNMKQVSELALTIAMPCLLPCAAYVSGGAQIGMALCYLGYGWAADRLCKEYLEISRLRERLFVIFFLMGSVLADIINECYSIPYIILALGSHAFLAGLVMLMFRGNKAKKLLAASLLIALMTLAGSFLESFLALLTLFLMHMAKNITDPFLGEWGICLITYIRYAVIVSVICWISKRPIAFVPCQRQFFMDECGGSSDKSQSCDGRWHVILAVPLLAFATVVDVAGWGASNGILVRADRDVGLYYDQIFSHAGMCMLTVLSMSAAGLYILGMNRIYLEQRKSERYHAQIAAYKMLEEQYSQSERLRHDMKNHIIALSGLLENKELEKMDAYLRSMRDSGSLGDCEEVTGNRAVDALLCQKRQMAQDRGILWECDVQVPGDCCIDEFDLCILFGNILDNAVEACDNLPHDGERFIHIQAKPVKKCFLMEVKNSAGTEGILSAEKLSDSAMNQYEAGFTSKTNADGHGIGLMNVRDVVRKYNGTVSIEASDGRFVISVLMTYVTSNQPYKT